MAIEVEGGLIQQVVPWSSVAATEFVDWSADTVIPGFVDAHVHLLFTCDADHTVTRTAVESSSPAQLALTGAQSAVECLLGGVTTVRDCGDKDFLTLELRDAIAATGAGTWPTHRTTSVGRPGGCVRPE
jgi:imidazolonepropionase-like amidohydrolase